MEEAKWKDLPAELLLAVASHCGASASSLRGVCQDWKTGLESVITQLIIVNTPPPLNLPERFPSLTILDLRRCGAMVTPECLHCLQGLPLTSLAVDLEPENLTVEFVGELRGLALARLVTSLAGGSQRRENFGDVHLLRLAGLPIACLNLSNTRISGAGLSVLRQLPVLSELGLSRTIGCPIILDKDMLKLEGLPLTSLNLRCQDRITDVGMQVLKGMPLTDLSINLFNMSDVGLEALRGVPLTKLEVFNPRGITDQGFEVLRGMKLADLKISGVSTLTSTGLAVLSGMPIQNLDLMLFLKYLDDAGMGVLRGLPLTSLSIKEAGKISDAGIGALQGMPLKKLFIRDALNISDAGMEVLRYLPLLDLRLENLSEITDAGLEVLTGKHFERLLLQECPRITEKRTKLCAKSFAFIDERTSLFVGCWLCFFSLWQSGWILSP